MGMWVPTATPISNLNTLNPKPLNPEPLNPKTPKPFPRPKTRAEGAKHLQSWQPRALRFQVIRFQHNVEKPLVWGAQELQIAQSGLGLGF